MVGPWRGAELSSVVTLVAAGHKCRDEMAECGDEDFDAPIISTTKFGFIVELTDLFIEGLAPSTRFPATSTLIRRTSARSWGSRRGREF